LPLELVKATPPDGSTVLLVGTWADELFECLRAQPDLGIVWTLDGAETVELAHKLEFDVCLCSLQMGAVDGFAVTRALLEADPDAAVVISTHLRDTAAVVKAMRTGALDYVNEPHEDLDELVGILRRAARRRGALRHSRELMRSVPSSTHFHDLVGASPVFLDACRQLLRVAGTDASVLIEGESGSGKELAAKAVHSASPRAAGPLMAVNCAALPPELLTSELFGHVRGAFTGAERDRKGLFLAADGGSLFLDEIGLTRGDFQAKLLRAIETGEVRPVGSEENVRADVRIIAASNTALHELVTAGRFRRDLLYRIDVMKIVMPPLRERRGDVELLAAHFLEHFASAAGKPVRGFSPLALGALEAHTWPGNVRELRNAIERAVVYDTDGVVGIEDLPPPISLERDSAGAGALPEGQGLDEATADLQRRMIRRALGEAAGVKAKAARALGLKRTTLLAAMKRLGLAD